MEQSNVRLEDKIDKIKEFLNSYEKKKKSFDNKILMILCLNKIFKFTLYISCIIFYITMVYVYSTYFIDKSSLEQNLWNFKFIQSNSGNYIDDFVIFTICFFGIGLFLSFFLLKITKTKRFIRNTVTWCIGLFGLAGIGYLSLINNYLLATFVTIICLSLLVLLKTLFIRLVEKKLVKSISNKNLRGYFDFFKNGNVVLNLDNFKNFSDKYVFLSNLDIYKDFSLNAIKVINNCSFEVYGGENIQLLLINYISENLRFRDKKYIFLYIKKDSIIIDDLVELKNLVYKNDIDYLLEKVNNGERYYKLKEKFEERKENIEKPSVRKRKI